jgi:hypothetical protein
MDAGALATMGPGGARTRLVIVIAPEVTFSVPAVQAVHVV